MRLLRVIQTREIERVGGEKPIAVDIRIIAATHQNLEQMVREGRFREDLWFRLNVFPITVPPLRHRKSDIPALVEYFSESKSRELNLHHDPSQVLNAIKQHHDYHWPGNVRELENLVERALIRSRSTPPGTPLSLEGFLIDSDMDEQKTELQNPSAGGTSEPLPLNLNEANRRIIQTALKMTNGRV